MCDGAAYGVFLSYSRADSTAAETLRTRLKEAGVNAFLDRYGLPAGQPWQPWLEQHLSSCRALVALVGPRGFGEWQHREIQLGLDRQASAAKTGERFPVIPVLLPGLSQDAVPVGSFLRLNTWVDLRNGLDEPESLQRLVAGAQGQTIDAAAAEKLLAGLTPYRGLLPFREQDSGLFFGRERFVEELVRKVGQRSDANVVGVIGRSGSGKSSIVYAGLFPALRRERDIGDQSVWQILHLSPHAEPLNELALAFNPLRADLGPVDRRAALNRLASRLRNREVSLAELVRDRLRDELGSTRLLLYVDQWEELYTLAAPREPKNEEERGRIADVTLFIDLVLEAAAKSPCTLVLSARSDFYPDIQNHNDLRIAVQNSQISLGTMNKEELEAVIERPPMALGASVDPSLTEKLIRDIGLDPASRRIDEYDIGKLPLLEYALEQAWAKRTRPLIGRENYSGLEQALEERANALYRGLSTEEQAAAKRLFVSLVTPGEGREDTRARIDMPEDAAMRRVIQTFARAEARLIVTDSTGERGSVEVTHEALIRHWGELRAWIDANRDNLRTRARLKEDRTEWLKRNKDPGLLGIPSLRLKEVQKLSEEPGDVRIDDINDYIQALLDYDRKRKEAEESKQAEELARVQQQRRIAQIGSILFPAAAAGAFCGGARALSATVGIAIANYGEQRLPQMGDSFLQGFTGGFIFGLSTAFFLAFGWIFRGSGCNHNRVRTYVALGVLGGIVGGIGVTFAAWSLLSPVSLLKIGWITDEMAPSLSECIQRKYCLFYPALGPAYGAGMGLAVAWLYMQFGWQEFLRSGVMPQGAVAQRIINLRGIGIRAIRGILIHAFEVSASYLIVSGFILFASAILVAPFLPEPINSLPNGHGVMLRALGDAFSIWTGNIGAVYGVAIVLLTTFFKVRFPDGIRP